MSDHPETLKHIQLAFVKMGLLSTDSYDEGVWGHATELAYAGYCRSKNMRNPPRQLQLNDIVLVTAILSIFKDEVVEEVKEVVSTTLVKKTVEVIEEAPIPMSEGTPKIEKELEVLEDEIKPTPVRRKVLKAKPYSRT